MSQESLIQRTTAADLETVCARLPEVVQRHKFGVLATFNLRQKLADRGVAFDHECRVFEVCNPQQAKEVLSRALSISAALPCRISVYAEEGRTVLATIKPTVLLQHFDTPGAATAARAVEEAMIQILEEAAGS